MYKNLEDEWVETHEWWPVHLTENSPVITGIALKFLGLPELLLRNGPVHPAELELVDMVSNRVYRFEHKI